MYPATYDIVVLQNSTFRMQIAVTQSGGTPVSLSGYTIDADICSSVDRQQVSTFSSSVINAASGIVQLHLPPSTTSQMAPGSYVYDVSATAPNGDRYFWLKGDLTMEPTCSRS